MTAVSPPPTVEEIEARLSELQGRINQAADALDTVSDLRALLRGCTEFAAIIAAQVRLISPAQPERADQAPDGTWLTTAEAGQRARRSADSIRKLMRNGFIHDHQAAEHGPRIVHIDVLDAWRAGATPAQQKLRCPPCVLAAAEAAPASRRRPR